MLNFKFITRLNRKFKLENIRRSSLLNALQKVSNQDSFKGGITAIVGNINENQSMLDFLGVDKRVNEKTFMNKCNANNKKHHLNISELIVLLDTLHDQDEDLCFHVLQELVGSWGYECKKKSIDNNEKIITANEVLSTWMEWDKDRGESQHIIRDALSDGKISNRELMNIKKEINDDHESTSNMMLLLDKIQKQKGGIER